MTGFLVCGRVEGRQFYCTSSFNDPLPSKRVGNANQYRDKSDFKEQVLCPGSC